MFYFISYIIRLAGSDTLFKIEAASFFKAELNHY